MRIKKAESNNLSWKSRWSWRLSWIRKNYKNKTWQT